MKTKDIRHAFLKAKATDDGKIVVVASNEAVDRTGEIIRHDAWDLTNFKNNPVMLLFHDYNKLPVGKWDAYIDKKAKALIAVADFASTSSAKEVEELVRGGYMNAVSVGFIAHEYDKENRNVITKAELLEISWVPVPANQEALKLMMEKGFKFSCSKGSENTVGMYKSIVKEYRKMLKRINRMLGIKIEGEVSEEEQMHNLEKAIEGLISQTRQENLDEKSNSQANLDIEALVKDTVGEVFEEVFNKLI